MQRGAAAASAAAPSAQRAAAVLGARLSSGISLNLTFRRSILQTPLCATLRYLLYLLHHARWSVCFAGVLSQPALISMCTMCRSYSSGGGGYSGGRSSSSYSGGGMSRGGIASYSAPALSFAPSFFYPAPPIYGG